MQEKIALRERLMKELILAEREVYGMSNSWDEYLVLRCHENQGFLLYTGKFECLTEASKFWNDETEEYELPDRIDGKKVVCIKDGYVVGGELDYEYEKDAIAFKHSNSPDVLEWLEKSEWADDVEMTAIDEGIDKLRDS